LARKTSKEVSTAGGRRRARARSKRRVRVREKQRE
jgi:hypothetical protein